MDQSNNSNEALQSAVDDAFQKLHALTEQMIQYSNYCLQSGEDGQNDFSFLNEKEVCIFV